MSRRLYLYPPDRLRRIGAALALLGFVFASTIASVAHSTAMPMTASAVLQDAGQAQPASHHVYGVAARQDASQPGQHMGDTAHDCQSDATADAPPQKPPGPCDEGCLLCKDCTMTSFLLMSPIGIDGAERYGTYQPATAQTLAGITLPSPNEPPRL